MESRHTLGKYVRKFSGHMLSLFLYLYQTADMCQGLIHPNSCAGVKVDAMSFSTIDFIFV